jgi:photosystem II stability/assembly factor-like uncharacterized protein
VLPPEECAFFSDVTMNDLLNLAAAVLLGALVVTPAAASDPLLTPARLAPRASKSMMTALTLAGTRAIAVGERGIILYRDVGETWQQARVPVSVTLTSVAFAGNKRGWVVGHDGVILATDDGGQQWALQFDGKRANALMLADAKAAVAKAVPVGGDALAEAENALADLEAATKFGPSRPLLGVWFCNQKNGYAVGAYGQAFRTGDGGETWTSMALAMRNPEGLHLNAIAGASENMLAIAAEAGRVYRSNDGGMSWTSSETGYRGQLYGVLFTGRSLLAYGFGGHIFRSADQGVSWRESYAVTTKSLVAGTVQDNRIVLAAQDGTLLSSDDDGDSFHIVREGDAIATAGMVASKGTVLLAGIGGVRSVTGGPQ